MKTVNVGTVDRVLSIAAAGVLLQLGTKKNPAVGTLMGAAAAELLRRGVTGHCFAYEVLGVRTAANDHNATLPYELGIPVEYAVTVNRPREEVFRFWRDLNNLPKFMKHLKSVTQTGEKTSHWVVEGPAGKTVEWDAEIHNEVENQLIGWRTIEGATVESAGSVNFKPAPGGRGTEVILKMQYNPPAGRLGDLFATLLGHSPGLHVRQDLRRLKQLLESKDFATVEGQTSGREADKAAEKHAADKGPGWQNPRHETHPVPQEAM